MKFSIPKAVGMAVILAFCGVADARPVSDTTTSVATITNSVANITTPFVNGTLESILARNLLTRHVQAVMGYREFSHGKGHDWPGMDEWKSFDDLWNRNQRVFDIGCDWQEVHSTTWAEKQDIRRFILEHAAASGVDPRVILAVILQESNGCVRTRTTAVTHANPGLMQSHMGQGNCNNGGNILDPCPPEMISLMIRDGTMGTSSGNGLMQTIAIAKDRGFSGALAVYWGARMYNSGENISMEDLHVGYSATGSYASDVANILLGWVKA